MTVRRYSYTGPAPHAILSVQGHYYRKDSKVARKEWRASSDGPDWMDIAQMLWYFDNEYGTSSAIFMEPVMSRGGGSIYICISVRMREAVLGEVRPSLGLVQAYWPEPEGRRLEPWIFFLLARVQDTAWKKIEPGSLLPEG